MNRRIDILIRDGIVIDGTGSAPYEADIGIVKDKIAFIERRPAAEKKRFQFNAARVVDARDMSVAPGFIDTHAHSEFTLLADPRAEGKICQGITTEINGNCGLSAAPLFGEALKQREDDLREFGISERWSTFGEYFETLERRDIALNFVTLTGHGNLRACAAGYGDRKLTAAEREEIKSLLLRTMGEGSLGLSSGLIYPPGIYSDTEELIDLCRTFTQSSKEASTDKSPRRRVIQGGPGRIAGKTRNVGIYTTHMRSEGDRLLEAIAEAIQIGEESGMKVHISHVKTSGEKNWHKIDGAISMIEKARGAGLSVTCDRYPYNASSTDLDTVLPSWVYEGGSEEELRKLKDPEIGKKIKREILREYPEKRAWDNIYVSSVQSEENKWMEGKSIADIASRENCGPVDLLMNILIGERLRIGATFSSMSEENLKRFLSLPYLMIGTDSSARSLNGPTRKGKPHPRGFGSLPRFLGRYVRDNALMPLEEAVRKTTALPAGTFSIDGRGVLKRGAYADVVVFDYQKIADRATFEEPFLKPGGIHYVIINGIPALWEGELTGVRAGRVLRHGR
jgi:N-acyl-D-amino-acid deacylase